MSNKTLNVVLAIAALASASAKAGGPECDNAYFDYQYAVESQSSAQSEYDSAQSEYTAAEFAYEHCTGDCSAQFQAVQDASARLTLAQTDLDMANADLNFAQGNLLFSC